MKISPDDVLHLLHIIRDSDSRKIIEEGVLEYYKQSSRLQTPHHNPFRTRVAHSLKKLLLLGGEKYDYYLTPEGKHLCNFPDDSDKYRKELAKMVLRIDIEKCHVIEIFKQHGSMTYNQVIKVLNNYGTPLKKSDDKLRRWLQFLTFCKIISYDKPRYNLDTSMLESLQVQEQDIPIRDFEEALYEEYSALERREGAYVQLPVLKASMSKRFKSKGFSPLDFKRHLLAIIDGDPARKILLHETGVRGGGGLVIDNTYYHFITIQNE